jgi:alpha-galactosidase
MQQIQYFGPDRETTLFIEKDARIWLWQLCGLTCGSDGNDAGPAYTRGPAIVQSASDRFEDDEFSVVERDFQTETARIVWATVGGELRLDSDWSFCPSTGVVSRKDRLTNAGSAAVKILRFQSRFAFSPGRYEVYAQDSRWCNENQGAWMALHAGSLQFGCVQGRTTQGGTPYLCLREVGAGRGLAFHLLPCGNWSIAATARAVMDGYPFAVVDLGLADDELRLELPPGASVEGPEILIQSLPGGAPAAAAPRLHRWLLERRFAEQRPEIPLIYNTWFDQFEVLEVPRLRRQLQAAKEIGCEVFVVDAGWYGPQAGDWFSQAGDWREKTDGAFHGAMAAFADEVRAAGLGFGLWMEPERFGPNVPIRREHSEWFLPRDAAFARINLTNAAAYAHLRAEISRLVETYRLAWMKIDFNFELGLDRSGGELSGYYRAWYRLLDEIRREHPQTIFEGCASGGMRLELASLSHFDAQFLSDTVNPLDVLRIWQNALLRLPPGNLIKWAVVRSAGRTIPRYTKSLADSPVAIVTPCGALWEPAETTAVDFAAMAAMPGVFGLSGDLAGLPDETRSRLGEHVAFWKQWRQVIRRSAAYLLTPPEPKAKRDGWIAVQISDTESGTSLLFAYRLNDGSAVRRFALRGLDSATTYELAYHAPPSESPRSALGADLMSDGVEITLPSRYQAAVIVLTDKNSSFPRDDG